MFFLKLYLIISCWAILLLLPYQPTHRLRLLEPFQHGEIPTLIAHIEEGLRMFNECELEGEGGGRGKGLLVFSG